MPSHNRYMYIEEAEILNELRECSFTYDIQRTHVSANDFPEVCAHAFVYCAVLRHARAA